jgi:RND family efflux transporter MFP subunit
VRSFLHLSAARTSSSLLLMLLALSACDRPGTQAGGAPPVTVAEPLSKSITEWDEYTGRFEAVQSVDVRARVSGYLTSIAFKDGQIVKAGDLLFVIDARPYQATLDQAKAALARAETQQQLASNDLDRVTKLLQSRAVSVEEYDTRLQQKKEADAAVEGSKAAVRSAELDLSFTQIHSPIAGRASSKRIDVGNLVTGGNGGNATLLTTVVSLNPIRFVFDASEAAYLRYSRLAKTGERTSSRDVANPVFVRLADETEWTRRGQMDFVDNQLNAKSGTIRGRAIFTNDDLFLTPGVFGRLRLLAQPEHQALLIPDSAVLSDQSRKVVAAVAADGAVEFRPVVLGPIVDGLRVIRDGLTTQDRIVIDGLQRVRPGAKVAPKDGKIEALTASAGP